MTSMPRFGWAGLLIGPAAWLLSTQLGQALVPWGCNAGLRPAPVFTAALAVVALGGAAWSGRAWRATPPEQRTERLLAALSAALALLFALVIAMQLAAGLFLTGCEE